MAIHHIAFRCSTPLAMAKFYADLGLGDIEPRPNGSYWIRVERTIFMFEQRGHGEPAPVPSTLELLCFAIAPEGREQARARIVAAGSQVEAETAYTLYFRDPEGRRLAFSHYLEPQTSLV
jgi:catechol 2,3-dioxygenase-like lactoylglutathione lyase family enzyme